MICEWENGEKTNKMSKLFILYHCLLSLFVFAIIYEERSEKASLKQRRGLRKCSVVFFF